MRARPGVTVNVAEENGEVAANLYADRDPEPPKPAGFTLARKRPAFFNQRADLFCHPA